MHPIIASFWVFLPDELVVLAVGLDPGKPFTALLDVPVNAQIRGLACHVLAVADSAHSLVQGRGTITAAYLDGFAHCCAQRLQHVVGQCRQVYRLLKARLVLNVACLGRVAGRQFCQREVLAQ